MLSTLLSDVHDRAPVVLELPHLARRLEADAHVADLLGTEPADHDRRSPFVSAG